MKKILLVDGNGLVFRAYYATAYSNSITLRANDGTPTNALLGFITMLEKILKQNYDLVLVAFDAGPKNFRYGILPSYKEKRVKTPQELLQQLPLVREFLDAYGIQWYEHPDFEADDIIATINKKAIDLNWEIEILSSDGDLEQLLSANTVIVKPKQGLSQVEIINVDSLKARWDISPNQIPDLKGLKGDASDNLPGIKGIGEKTALSLLHQFGTLENIITHQEELKTAVKEKIVNNANIGLLCKEMASLRYDVPFPKDLSSLTINTDLNRLEEFYLKYNLKSLVNRLETNNPSQDNNNKDQGKILNKWDANYNCVENALFVEMNGDNYYTSDIIGFGVVNDKGAFYLDYLVASTDELFLAFLKDEKCLKDVFDLKKVINGCKWHHIEVKGIAFDLQLASYILNANMKVTINNVINYFAEQTFMNDEMFYGKNQKKVVRELQEVAGFITRKAWWILHLKPLLSKKLEQQQQLELYKNIEFPCAFVLAKMEFHGIRVDMEQLEQLTKEVLKIVTQLNEEINSLAQQDVNPNSPKQLKELLFDVLKLPDLQKGSTAQEVLMQLQMQQLHPIIDKILEYRKYQKTYSTYLKGLEKYIFADGKVHTIYNQTNTTTGRLSSQEPNMQNISIHDVHQKLVRKVFVPNDSGTQVVLSSDYSQIELKVLAHMANVKELIKAFKNNEDIHSLTASKIFSINQTEVSEQQRRVAKTVNFGIVYGISDFGLSKQLMISISEAKKIIERYFAVFPEIRHYMDNTIKFCQEHKFVKTLFNRIRYIPTINDRNWVAKQAAERVAINAPIQGTAADIIKLALIKIDQQLEQNNLKSYLVAQVHDELIVEVYENELEIVKKIVNSAMNLATKLQVPLTVDINIGNNWYEV
ncbi:DNA polymerase I [Spiroplasma endosymbiont of Nephrotoma flavescens]|uniref:DNA polymerase I n=1 Tax=Spiroplasma endosymbiont of Nephrotoma flavescens TaxID=3066302 RepID=UPI00313C0EAC